MIDSENVIKGLEICVDRVAGKYTCNECPYEIDENNCEINLAKDAIALLKYQEPVKPVNVRWEMGINGGNCPKCMNWVQRTYNYCPFCGKAVKWE